MGLLSVVNVVYLRLIFSTHVPVIGEYNDLYKLVFIWLRIRRKIDEKFLFPFSSKNVTEQARLRKLSAL